MNTNEEERYTKQWYVIKFLHAQGKSRIQPLTEVQGTYGNRAVSRATIYQWYDLFVRGRDSTKLKGKPGTPRWATTEVLTNTCAVLLAKDTSMTLHELKDDNGKASIFVIIVKLAHICTVAFSVTLEATRMC